MHYNTWLSMKNMEARRRASPDAADTRYTERLSNSRQFSGLSMRHFVMARIAHVGTTHLGYGGQLDHWGQFADSVY